MTMIIPLLCSDKVSCEFNSHSSDALESSKWLDINSPRPSYCLYHTQWVCDLVCLLCWEDHIKSAEIWSIRYPEQYTDSLYQPSSHLTVHVVLTIIASQTHSSVNKRIVSAQHLYVCELWVDGGRTIVVKHCIVIYKYNIFIPFYLPILLYSFQFHHTSNVWSTLLAQISLIISIS